MEIKRSLELGEYNDPVQVRRLLRSGKFEMQEFKDALWSSILEAFPCPKEGGIPQNLTTAKQKLWQRLCEEEPELSEHERIEKQCRCSNLCMQCESKKQIIAFFAGIDTGSDDTIRHRLASWLSGRVRKLERITCIQLCFAMNMRVYPEGRQLSDAEKLTDANRFLTLACRQPPLYTMKPDEAVYYYCLANPCGRSNVENWNYACRLIDRISESASANAGKEMHTMYAAAVIEGITTEEELLDFVMQSSVSDHELYATAKENCRLLFELFDISEDISNAVDEGRTGTGKYKKKRNVLKKVALSILDAISNYDESGRIDSDVLELLERYEFGDILYCSDRLESFLDDGELPDRTLLLLTVLAQNCGMKYDPETNTLEESDDLTDLPSFSEYFNSLSVLLSNMGMAPLYPRRRIDFIVLYAYHMLQKDVLGDREVGALSDYIIRALKLTMEGINND